MDRIVTHLRRNRDLDVPEQDEALLEDYWARMRHLRSQVDEAMLADSEVAVTWSPVEEQA
jgi:hypothetical protein